MLFGFIQRERIPPDNMPPKFLSCNFLYDKAQYSTRKRPQCRTGSFFDEHKPSQRENGKRSHRHAVLILDACPHDS
jgi:hypothetical protein